MTKQQLLSPYAANPALRLTLARLLDQHQLAEERGLLGHSFFFTPEEQAEAMHLLSRLPPCRFCMFGGYEEAERKICVFLPEWWEESQLWEDEDSPLCVLDVTVPPMAALTHRDYLGALMGLGISREKFGDILLSPEGTQVILLKEVRPLVESQWESVGRYPISLRRVSLSEIRPPQLQIKMVKDTVASLRLDSLVASGFSLARSRASELIAQGRIFRNHRICDKPHQEVSEGDVISCRGMGKFVLRRVGGNSKKGRILIEIDRYE